MKKMKQSRHPHKRSAKTARRRTIVATRSRQLHVSPERRARAATADSVEIRCSMTRNIFDIGLGFVVLCRKLSSGRIASSIFLVDVYCLGVRRAYYEEHADDLACNQYLDIIACDDLIEIEPAYACKLVLGSVDYAQNLGFTPRKGYAAAVTLFGDIDPASCTDEIVFGKNSKPLYIPAPGDDTPMKVRAVVSKLKKKIGEKNFEFDIAA